MIQIVCTVVLIRKQLSTCFICGTRIFPIDNEIFDGLNVTFHKNDLFGQKPVFSSTISFRELYGVGLLGVGNFSCDCNLLQSMTLSKVKFSTGM